MVEVYSLVLLEAVALIDKGIGKGIVDLVEPTCKCPIWNLAEVKQVHHHLIQVWSIWSRAVVAVLFSNELVGLVSELSLNHILEPKFVEGVGLFDYYFLLTLKDLLIGDSVSESVEKDRLDFIPDLKTEVNIEIFIASLVLIHVIPPISVPGSFSMNIFPTFSFSILFIIDFHIASLEEQFGQQVDVFGGSDNHVERKDDYLEGVHAEDGSFDIVGSMKIDIRILSSVPLVHAIVVIP